MKYLVIDACPRDNSRTRMIYKEYIKNKNVNILYLYDLDIKPLDNDNLNYRLKLINDNNYDDKIFDLAKEFIKYDEIIVACPYWDLSFPSILKVYLENISISGITFKYKNGESIGLAKAKRFLYFSTSGGKCGDLGYNYVKELFLMFGIKNGYKFYIDNLDVDFYDTNLLLNDGIKRIMNEIEELKC